MPKGGIRRKSSDGSLDHLIKPKWKSGQTRTIRVPVVLAEQLLEIAHKLDDGDTIDPTQDNSTNNQLATKDLRTALALLEKAIKPKAEGGSYVASNATGMKRLVKQAVEILNNIEV